MLHIKINITTEIITIFYPHPYKIKKKKKKIIISTLTVSKQRNRYIVHPHHPSSKIMI